MKKILIIDDSALMRRVMSDIISKKKEYMVAFTANNGKKGLDIIEEKIDDIDAVICDINMPKMNGLELLKIINERKYNIPFIMFSTETDAKDTITALELGAIEFIKKPDDIFEQQNPRFENRVFYALDMAIAAKAKGNICKYFNVAGSGTVSTGEVEKDNARKLVAICCSTGGPRALQSVLPKLPENLDAPIVLVQHMPEGFTKSLSARLDDLSEIKVKEAEKNDRLEKGVCYIAKGGTHLTVETYDKDMNRIVFDDAPPVVGLKPCANIMYRSLVDTNYDEIICVILTGMGADGTKGIEALKGKKDIYVIAQDEASSTVYGMPRAIYEAGLVNKVCALEDVAQEIINKTGVL